MVDNGSTDGTAAAVRRAHSWCEVIENGENLGYAGGNNVGLRWALAEAYPWVLVLNNDTLVPSGALNELMRYADRHPEVGAVQPLLVQALVRGAVDSAGHYLYRCPGIVDLRMGQPTEVVPAGPVSVFGACTAAALIRADALHAVGLFDDALFVLAEDVDLMFRLRLRGEDVHLLPSVRIAHKRGVSGGASDPVAARRRKFWLHRNVLGLALNYWPLRYLLAASPLLAFRALVAVWSSLAVPGQSCLEVWWPRLRARRRDRELMARLGLDRWFGRDPLPPA